MTESSRFSHLLAFLAKLMGQTRKCPEMKRTIDDSITKNTNRSKRSITGKDRKMDTNVETTGTELAELDAVVTDTETNEVVVASETTTDQKPAEVVYDGPMTITTRKAKAKDGKNGRGRGTLVCHATTPADAEKIANYIKATLPADEVIRSEKFEAPTFVTADEFIADQNREAQVQQREAQVQQIANDIIKAKGLSADDTAALIAAFKKSK